MIYYTIQTQQAFAQGQVIQKNIDNTYSLNDNTGLILGVVMTCTQIEDTSNYTTVIYVAGGGGAKVKLLADWDGVPSRFDFMGDGIQPVETNGVGWLIPNYPQQQYTSGTLVDAVIYK